MPLGQVKKCHGCRETWSQNGRKDEKRGAEKSAKGKVALLGLLKENMTKR